MNIKSCLTHPLVRNQNTDSHEVSLIHSRIIQEKSFLRELYKQWYTSIIKSLPNDILGPVIELGSGGGFFKKNLPGLITSDVLQTIAVDIVLDGQFLPFSNDSLKGMVMIDVFHHLPDVKAFFREATHCVRSGGVIIMIEPWTTMWSSLVWRYLHHEPFNPDAKQWNFPEDYPDYIANSALPWIVFDRDRKQFGQEFPEWNIKEIKLHTPLNYLLSGGVSYRSFFPGCLFGICRWVEGIMQPWIDSLAMFSMIILVRK